MGVSAMQTPEKQILPRAPTTYSQDAMLKWAQDLMRVLQQNLSSIARKANDDTTFTPGGDLNMGGHSITGTLNITYTGALTGGTANFASLRVDSTTATNTILSWLDAGATGVDLTFIKDSSSPAAGDVLYRILGDGRNSSGTLTAYTIQRSLIEDPTAGFEDSSWDLFTYVAGALGRRVRVRNGMDLNGAADPGAGNISVNSIVLAGSLTGGTTGTFDNGVFNNSITLGGTDGSSAGQVPGLVLRKRTSGTSETIGPSDGAGGFRGLLGYGATDYWYLRIGDTTTDDIQFNANGIPLFGGQIAFPATQNPSANANTLDDYEEAAWTPAFDFGGGTTGMTFGTRAGRYVKIGQVVIAQFDCLLSAKGSSTGVARVTGLPFTSLNDGQIGSLNIAFFSGMTGLTGAMMGYVNLNGTTAQLGQWSATTFANLTDTSFTNTSRIVGTAIYRAG